MTRRYWDQCLLLVVAYDFLFDENLQKMRQKVHCVTSLIRHEMIQTKSPHRGHYCWNYTQPQQHVVSAAVRRKAPRGRGDYY